MLGFDKASKTLGWLLDKSKDAIHELTIASSTNKDLFSGFDRNVLARNIEKNDVIDMDEELDLSKNASSKKRRIIKRQQQCCKDDQSVALKSIIRRAKRAKARDRARERTVNKKSTVLLNQSNPTNQHQIIDQQRDEQNDLIFRHQSISSSLPTSDLIHCGGVNKGVSVRESVVIKSKSRESSINYNYNDMITKDNEVGFDHNYENNHNNFCGIIQTPSLSALNIINLSTEIHINGKPWDNYSNQDLH
ncbi:hypothetical protein RND81_10G126300 [Saponaria officinalis]|uniref:CYCLOIDEA-like protein n=1 Tax=Saponaria officinalis TaxID=3572 RepID=A0AAW1I3Z9_SAPOF